jgi:hypothetical protein
MPGRPLPFVRSSIHSTPATPPELSAVARALWDKVQTLDRIRPAAVVTVDSIVDQFLRHVSRDERTPTTEERARFARARAASAAHNYQIGAWRCAAWLAAHPDMPGSASER